VFVVVASGAGDAIGLADVNDVLDAMEYAVYVHDVRHVVIDNLQV